MQHLQKPQNPRNTHKILPHNPVPNSNLSNKYENESQNNQLQYQFYEAGSQQQTHKKMGNIMGMIHHQQNMILQMLQKYRQKMPDDQNQQTFEQNNKLKKYNSIQLKGDKNSSERLPVIKQKIRPKEYNSQRNMMPFDNNPYHIADKTKQLNREIHYKYQKKKSVQELNSLNMYGDDYRLNISNSNNIKNMNKNVINKNGDINIYDSNVKYSRLYYTGNKNKNINKNTNENSMKKSRQNSMIQSRANSKRQDLQSQQSQQKGYHKKIKPINQFLSQYNRRQEKRRPNLNSGRQSKGSKIFILKNNNQDINEEQQQKLIDLQAQKQIMKPISVRFMPESLRKSPNNRENQQRVTSLSKIQKQKNSYIHRNNSQSSQQKQFQTPLKYYQQELQRQYAEQCLQQMNYLYFSCSNDKVDQWSEEIMIMFARHDEQLNKFHDKNQFLKKFDHNYFAAELFKAKNKIS